MKMTKRKLRKIIREEIQNIHNKIIFEGISTNDINKYLEAALWSSTSEDGTPLNKIASIRDIDKSVVRQAEKDLKDFYSRAKNIIENGDYDGDWRIDFWLTRNGHGSGFWDDTGEDGDKLTKIADRFDQIDLYVGDDGKIYQF